VNVLTVDIGGTNVKFLASAESEARRFPSGRDLTPRKMVSGVRKMTRDWKYDRISIGYPGPVFRGRPITEPANLGAGWVGFDFALTFDRPVRVINDAAMQALGSYQGGAMLFLGLGTGLGTAMIVDGVIEPMELAHLRFRKRTYEDYVGQRGLDRYGKKKWRALVDEVVEDLRRALEPTDVVIGGGNSRQLKTLPRGCRLGDNANAFIGGFRLWQRERKRPR
jgi:polyphosphate glucokinase